MRWSPEYETASNVSVRILRSEFPEETWAVTSAQERAALAK
jgi:hypothetical protein